MGENKKVNGFVFTRIPLRWAMPLAFSMLSMGADNPKTTNFR
jgi:hypothetical protein